MKAIGFKTFPNYIIDVPSIDKSELYSYFKILTSIALLTNHGVYIIDFHKGELPFISKNPFYIDALKKEDITNLLTEYNSKLINEEEFKMISRIIKDWFDFIEKRPLEKRKNYILEYDYHIVDNLICVSMIPMFLCNEGKPWLILCTTKASTHRKAGNPTIREKGNSKSWYYKLSVRQWIEKKAVKLNDIEEKIIRLSIQGKKETEISETIFRSKDGLKSIKRRMFHKMNVNNITEATAFAIAHGLI